MINADIQKIKKSADYIRYLALEGIEQANSGHPGLPLGCAEIGVLLYRYILTINPTDPLWLNRDRFILSAGHGSMLLYPLLYAAGFAISLKDMGQFRQLHSKTPGHPEYEPSLGIETTTGPLGQGFANAVGVAIEGKMMAQRFNTADTTLFDYTVYTLMGDGCMMEGISYEAASMAGHLGLDNLVAIYDSNRISIDGRTDITFTEDVAKRFEAQHWHVEQADIANIEDVFNKLLTLKNLKNKQPKLLIVKTTIGEGVKEKKDTPEIHGAPAGMAEIAYFIQHNSIPELFSREFGEDITNTEALINKIREHVKTKQPLLEYSPGVAFIREGITAAQQHYHAWQEKFKGYQNNYPELYTTLKQYQDFTVTPTLQQKLLTYKAPKTDATRNISGALLNACAEEIPQLIGGCADLRGSTKAAITKSHYIQKDDFSGRNIAFGIREHAMGAVANGLALNKGFIPFTSTFFTFFDYMKPPIRLAALMKLKHLFIFSHDSIYVGEDGPTHQPIEHLNALRLIPELRVFRPGNDMETAFSFLYFLQDMKGPAALITTRQNFSEIMFQLPVDRDQNRQEWYQKFSFGGYVFYQTNPGIKPDIILVGSGSELDLAIKTAKLFEEKNKMNVRVVSIPCLELLNETTETYQKELLTPNTPLVLMETASHRGVKLFYNRDIILIDIESFGLSAPGETVAQEMGFTPEAVYQKIAGKGI